MPNESVRLDVEIDARAAIQQIRELMNGAEGMAQKVQIFAQYLEALAKKTGASWQELLTIFRMINAEASRMHGQTVFGNIGGKNQNQAFDLVQQYMQAADAAGRFAQSQAAANKAMNAQILEKYKSTLQSISKLDFSNIGRYRQNIQSLSNAIGFLSRQTGQSFESIGSLIQKNLNVPKVAVTDAIRNLNNELRGLDNPIHRAIRGIDAIRIALGAVVAMIVFQVVQAFGNFFRMVIKNASETEMAIYRLEKAERSLSEAGIEITPKGLASGIEEIQKQFSFLSKTDISKLLGTVALLTKELKLSEDQIIELAKSIVVLNINSQQTEDILQTADKVITSMITGKAQGVADLGLAFSENALQAKAMELGILKAGDAVSKLTDAQKAQVKYAIAVDVSGVENAEQTLKDVDKYLKTFEGRIGTFKSAWEDFGTVFGQFINPFIAGLATAGTAVIKFLDKSIQGVKAFVILWFSSLTAISAYTYTIFHGGSISQAIQFAVEGFKSARDEMAEKFFPKLSEAADTATGSIDKLAESMTQLQEAMRTANFDDLLNDLEDFQRKAEQMEQDFTEKLARMQEDYDRDRERAEQDYQIDRQRTIEDFARRRREAEEKYRQKEKDSEARFQEQMRQLREKFLFNLEDALHERDARQVLRLIRQYNMDKQALINEEALRRNAAIQEHKDEMERLRQDEADRLRQMEEEYQIKQQRAAEDYALKVARENEEHKQDMDRLKEQIDERLKTFADKLAEELGLREGGAEEIYKVLQKYYGAGGYFDGLYDYSAKSMAERASQMLSMLQQIMAQYAAISSVASMPISVPNLGSAPRLIGGKAIPTTMSAIRPPSLATSGGITSGREGMSGQLGVEILLSPDLEARIVENSVNNVADVITKVRRTK